MILPLPNPHLKNHLLFLSSSIAEHTASALHRKQLTLDYSNLTYRVNLQSCKDRERSLAAKFSGVFNVFRPMMTRTWLFHPHSCAAPRACRMFK